MQKLKSPRGHVMAQRCTQCEPVLGVACATGRWWLHRPPTAHRSKAVSTVHASNSKKLPPPSSGPPDNVSGLAKSVLRDVVAGINSIASPTSSASTLPAAAPMHEDLRSPSYAIAALSALLFAACALLPLLPASTLLLNHRAPAAWQLLSSCFAHASLDSLLQCVFFTYVFGRVVERNHGSVATWAVYIACGAAGAALAWWMLPAKAGLLSSAAPAAAWGLFLVGVGLPRLGRKPLEVACMAPFAFTATTARYAPLASALVHEGTQVGQLVHLLGSSLAAGLAAGVLAAVERMKAEAERRRVEAKRQADAARQNEAVARIVDMAGQAAQQLGRKLG